MQRKINKGPDKNGPTEELKTHKPTQRFNKFKKEQIRTFVSDNTNTGTKKIDLEIKNNLKFKSDISRYEPENKISTFPFLSLSKNISNGSS